MVADVKKTRYVLAGENRTDRAFRQVRKNFASTQKAADNLSRFIGVAFAGVATAGIVRVADEFSNLEARIKNVTAATGDTQKVLNDLFDLSQRTGTAFGDTVDVFQRISLAAGDLGATNDQIAQVVGTVQKLGVVSGASGQQLGNALLQLSQGLATGVFRAEEFNSVIENTPAIANAIGQELGFSAGELRKLVLEGRLSSQAVFEALLNAAETANDQFAEIPPTVARSFTKVKNSFGLLVNELNKDAGVVAVISQTFDIFAETMRLVGQDVIKAANDLEANDGVQSWAADATKAVAVVLDTFRSGIFAIREFGGAVFDTATLIGSVVLSILNRNFGALSEAGSQFVADMSARNERILSFSTTKFQDIAGEAIANVEKASTESAKNVATTVRKTQAELQQLLLPGKADKDAQKKIREQAKRQAELAFRGAGRDLETDETDTVKRVYEERLAAVEAFRKKLEDQNKLTIELEEELAQRLVVIEEAKNSRLNEIRQAQDKKEGEVRAQKQKEAAEKAAEELDKLKSYFETVTGLTADTIDTLFAFQQASIASKAAAITNIFSNVLSSIGSESRKAFELNKKISIANAIVSTFEAINNALAVKPYPLGIALAASAAVKGFANVRAIKSQTFSGGGASSGGGGSGVSGAASLGGASTSNPGQGQANAPTTPTQAVSISLNGKRFDREDVLELLEGINEALGDGAQINVAA